QIPAGAAQSAQGRRTKENTVASRKTKRMAAVSALAACLVIGGAAFAQADGSGPCIHGQGQGGMGTGAPGNGKGNGYEMGWSHGCKHDDDKGGGKSNGESGSGLTVGVQVGLPGVAVPNAKPLAQGVIEDAQHLAGDGLHDGQKTIKDAAGDARTLGKDAVHNGLAIVAPLAQPAVGAVQGAVDKSRAATDQAATLARNDVSGVVAITRS